jgi:hypothetical protein
VIAGLALVHKGHLDHVARDLLHLGGQPPHLRPFLLVGSGDLPGQQVAQGVDRLMPLALAAVCPDIASPGATLRHRVCGSTAARGGRSFGRIRNGAPARAVQRRLLKTSRR